MAEKMKAGIIGVGAIGKIHAGAYGELSDVELVALADPDKQILTAESDRLQVKQRFTDYRQLLSTDLDVISVCVPNAVHCEIAVAAMEAGKHVLLEKPMAMNSTEAARICATAEKTGRTLQTGMVWRQNSGAEVLRDYVEKGLLGEIYHMRTVLTRRRGIPGLGGWFTTKAQSGGGPMIDLGVHWFDLAMWLSGLWQPTSVSAATYAKFGPRMEDYRYVDMWAGPPKYDGVFDVEDYATGFVRFGRQATLNFDISWAANTNDEGYVELLGSEGGARITDGSTLAIFTEHQGRVANIQPQYAVNQGLDSFAKQARKFLAACRGEAEPAATGAQGLIVMKLIDAIYASGAAGREVPIE